MRTNDSISLFAFPFENMAFESFVPVRHEIWQSFGLLIKEKVIFHTFEVKF